MAQLEHLNVTVADPKAFAAMLETLFDWHIRWEGEAMDGQGYTVHVGTDSSYLALYSGNGGKPIPSGGSSYSQLAGLNHIGIVVDDLETAEERVTAAGFTVGQHYDYEPGRRFYFDAPDGIEIEVVQYD